MNRKKELSLIPLLLNNMIIMRFEILADRKLWEKSFLIAVLIAGCTSSKQATKAGTQTLENIKSHIHYLADDKLEGRRTGTTGEKLAMEYISSQFSNIGLLPKGTENYYQAFDVHDGKKINPGTYFIINGDTLVTGKDFFPFPFSANQQMEALPSIALQEAEMPWFFDLKVVLNENKNNPHFDLQDYIQTNTKKAKERGASAIILYNSSAIDDKLAFDSKDKSQQATIPVLYVTKKTADKYFKDISATLTINFKVDIGEKKRVGHNVIGFINNNAENTIILGAHFDHLGYGEDGNSMIRNFDHPMIHNGADDNASGTAALIELARKLKASKATHNNYLFIAFSGEELGLFGSKYFTDHPTIDLKKVSYMINMDMVGRLNDSTKVITIGGYGTSSTWGSYYSAIAITARAQALQFKFDSSGTGPSDHTSFYRKEIPVLFYFTGLHSDYHKPTDDFDKINYNGEVAIVDHIFNLVVSLDNKPKPVFTKTREQQTTTSARFSVSLGIMPDYTYPGSGVKADGVTDGKAAQKAGLTAGDVIIQLGDHKISSLENYMQALGSFKKGDKTKVKFKRGEKIMEATVEF